MIRINLLGTPKPKNRRSALPATPSIEIGDVGSPMVKILVAIVLAAGVNGYLLYHYGEQKKQIAANMTKAEQENRELSDVKAKYIEHQKQADNYKRRVDVIDQLRNSQGTPVALLNTIGDTINNTETVWLDSMKDEGADISLEGMALSTDAVANLITNLQKTGYFKNIEIKETFQDTQEKDMQAFQFTLTCQKSGDKSSDKGKS